MTTKLNSTCAEMANVGAMGRHFKRTLMGICVLLIAALGSPVAKATTTTYDITFTLSAGGVNATAGSFTYNDSTNKFSAFNVVWDGITFDLTSSANAPSLNGTPCVTSTGGVLTGGAASFALLNHLCTFGAPDLTTDWFGKITSTTEFGLTTFDATNVNSITIYHSQGVAGGTAAGGGDWTLSTGTPPTPTPEPSAGLMMGTALMAMAALGMMRRREQQA